MNEISHHIDGKPIGKIIWPFKKFMVLIPERNDIDALAWLYVSFVRMYNKERGVDEFTYDRNTEKNVRAAIRQTFRNMIDAPTLDKITIASKDKYLDPVNHDSIKVFNNLFTDRLQIRYIFRDCITGSVVPYFYDTIEVESLPPDSSSKRSDPEFTTLEPKEKTRPDKKSVRLAYRRYLHRDEYTYRELEEISREYDREETEDDILILDEDTQLFEDDEPFFDFGESEEHIKLDPPQRQFDVKFIDGGTDVYYIVPVIVEDNRLSVKTPFEYSTRPWMNVCFEKGSKKNQQLKKIYNDFSIILSPSQKIEEFYEDPRNSIYGKLPHCAEIYRTIDEVGDDILRHQVWRLEEFYCRRDPIFFIECGKIFERLLKLIIESGGFIPSDAEFRRKAKPGNVMMLLKYKCEDQGIDWHKLEDHNIILKWKTKYEKRGGSFDFKSDFLDMILQSDITNSPLISKESVNNIWRLYGNRNKQAHDNENIILNVTSDSLKIMEESVKLLCQKINQGV